MVVCDARGVLLVVALGIGGFGCQSASAIADARPEPEQDDTCHVDCFGSVECHDGIVTAWANTPVPCDQWTGECPHHDSEPCERGCRVDTEAIYSSYEDPSVMCEENRPKQVGDPCVDDSYCDPQVATWDEDGNIINVYLQCDTEAGVCIEREPTVIEDWLGSCGLKVDQVPLGFSVVKADGCSGGLCIYSRPTELDCLAQGCTAPCDSDDDCPLGATCGDYRGVCVPGRTLDFDEIKCQ